MTITRVPHGLSVYGIPVIPQLADRPHTGNVFWVDSVNGSTNNGGDGSYDAPFTTIDYAIGQCTANNDDVIFAKQGHIETISAAGSLTSDVAGVTVVFLGDGAKRATLSFTGTAATIVASAANCQFIRPRLLTSIDAVVSGIVVSGTDFKMYDVEDYDAAAKASTIMVLTTSAAHRLVIDGYKYFASTTGTQKTDRIKTVGALDGVVLRNIDISGDFTGGYPVNLANAACTNIILENINSNNTNSGPVAAIGLHANTTGFAKNVKARVASGTTYVSSVSKVQWAEDCEGFNTDGYGGEPIGTPVASGVEGKIDVIDGYFDVPTADATTDATMRDVIGKKNDAAVNAVTTNKSVMAYTKGIINEITVPTENVADNAFINDVIGNKADAAIYALATDKSLAAYLKGILATAPRTAQSASATTLTNAATLFTIANGPIAIEYLISICIATGDGGAATLQYNSAPTVGSAATISGATGSLATAVAGSMVVFIGTALATAPTFLTTGHGVASTGTSKIVVNEGVITSVVGGSASTATWKHYLRYTPLATGVTVS